MKYFTTQILYLALVVALFASTNPPVVCAETIRQPVWAGLFYQADPAALAQTIDRITRKANKTRIHIPRDKHLRAIVMPHAGYIYSAWTAAHAAQVLKADRYTKVILLGPDHRLGFNNAAICDVDAYATPLGKINLHADIAKLRQYPDLFQMLSVSQDKEHSLEVILPFLQSYLDTFKLVPVMIGRGDTLRIANVLDAIIDSQTLLVVSSDFSHFLPYAEAVARDRETIDEIINLRPEKLVRTDNRACGKNPLIILTDIARRHAWQPLLLHYSNSGDTAGDPSRVVGYAAIAYFGDPPMKYSKTAVPQFSNAQGQALVKLARHTIMKKLRVQPPETATQNLIQSLKKDCFKLHNGTFVTLTINGQLRGCIGNLTTTEDVLQGVKQNAANAAFHDPRFTPLSIDELERIAIEISILTQPQPVAFRDGQDLIQKLRAHVDGVIIRKGPARATFLPQVWEQLPRPEDFLGHLCMKAGLPSDAWENSELEVLTYQVQYFEEDH